MPVPPTTNEDRRHVHTSRVIVRWGDMDAMGHVNNSRYFTYFEQARVDWLTALDRESMHRQVGPILAHASCDFKRPVTYPETLEIRLFLEAPGQKSFKVYHEAWTEEGELAASGTAVIVWFDFENGRSVALPEQVRALYEHTA